MTGDLAVIGDGWFRNPPVATSPLVDAIPLGTAGCSTSMLDMYGNPRGGDGNGDGIPGCDIGAIERPAAT